MQMSKDRCGPFLLVAILVTGVVGLSDLVWAQSLPVDVAARIDQLLVAESNHTAQGTPVPVVGDETFLRRVFMDLVGEPPTTEDVIAFSLDGTVDKRSRLVRQLLADASYGRNWARYWRDVIMYRRSDERALLSVRALESYLTDAFNDNTSWDKLTTEFITARGDIRENGKTALIMAQLGRPEDTVAEVSRIFLGIQIQCAQCHDHPTDRWTREQFHELVAFFPRVAVRPKRDDGMLNFEVVASDSPIENRSRSTNNRYRGTPEHRMPDLDNPEARGEIMKPVFFVTGDEVPVGSLDADRRSQLASWITDSTNPWFARAFVNRIWAELVGEGFYDPVDDLGPGRKCSSPKTLDYLAAAFRERGHDIKWLFATILSTDAYQRASRRRRNVEELPFQANCAQPLRADQLYSSLQAVLEIPESNTTSGRQRSSRFSPRNSFNSVFGFDPSTRRGDVAGTIPQALMMMNSPRINQYATAENGRMLGRLLREVTDDRQAITELYLRVLSRQPTDKEVNSCLKYRRNLRDRGEAFEDILWALINTAEFLHRK